MNRMIFVGAAVATHFFRLGQKWTKEGVIVDVDHFLEEEWQTLLTEANLKVRDATEDELATLPKLEASEPSTTDLLEHDDVIKALVDAIPGLVDTEFTKEGKPKLPALRKAVEIDGSYVTAETVETAMKTLTDKGFKPPNVE